ncbi:MAG: LytTR family transcriptional regulator DNA-binding domain-containing protein [Burkholderiales bacterium]|nr:LytTR family transcriptional regulator DNA-binding domain-containing protein [Burkholderiales bacterium]
MDGADLAWDSQFGGDRHCHYSCVCMQLSTISACLSGFVRNQTVISAQARFVRMIHRSTIVNARVIATVSRVLRGQASVKIKGCPENLAVSRPFSPLF